MSKTVKSEQLGIINLATLKDIVINGGQLTAPIDHKYAKRFMNFHSPVTRVVFINGNYIIGHGTVTLSWEHFCTNICENMTVFNIEPIRTKPCLLSKIQAAALDANLKQYAQTLKKITGVMPLAPEMNSLFPLPENPEPVLLGMYSESWLRSERRAIYDDDSIEPDEKLLLVQALDACGEHADDVWALNPIVCSEGAQDFEPYPIIPWECCDKEQLLDPHNWVILPSALASNFRMGLITFSDSGYAIYSETLMVDLHEFDIDYDFNIHPLTERQRGYMKLHREEIFDDWRTNPPWLSY